MKLMAILTLAGAVILALALVSALGRETTVPASDARAERPTVHRVGYFKSGVRDRVIAFRSDRRLTEGEAVAVFERLPRTGGRLFQMVVYSGDVPAPADALTLAPSLMAALQVTASPPFDRWDWIVFANPAGEVTVRAGSGREAAVPLPGDA